VDRQRQLLEVVSCIVHDGGLARLLHRRQEQATRIAINAMTTQQFNQGETARNRAMNDTRTPVRIHWISAPGYSDHSLVPEQLRIGKGVRCGSLYRSGISGRGKPG